MPFVVIRKWAYKCKKDLRYGLEMRKSLIIYNYNLF